MRTVKKTLCILLACVMLLTVLPAVPALAAGELIEGTHVRWSYNGDTKTLTFSGYGPMPDYTPAQLPPVSDVPWLEAEREAETLVIGNGITVIGDCCFILMPAVTRAVLPESLIRIGSYNFFACKNLAEVNLPSGLLSIGEGSFSFGRLTSVDIPAGVKSLSYCFNEMFFLTDVTLHEGLESIDNCFEITGLKSLTIPASVEKVTSCSFMGLKKLVNRSATAIVHELMDSYVDPADMELELVAMSLEYDVYIDLYYSMFDETWSEEEADAYLEEAYLEMLEQIRLWLNENRGAALGTLQETQDYLNTCFNRTGAPAPDAEIYCMYGSAEDKALDKTSIPHYLIDRDNAPCDAMPDRTGLAGEHITWSFDAATGTLTFTGYGAADCNLSVAPYHVFADEIIAVAFECTEGPITYIASGMFKGLNNLTSLTLPEGVEELGSDFMLDCGVRELTLPASIGYYEPWCMLIGSTPLQRITISGESDRYFTEHGALYKYAEDGKTVLIKFAYEAADYPLNENVYEIEQYAVEGLSDLTSFTVPGTVSNIWSCAFYDLPSLETLYLEPGEDALRSRFNAIDFSGSTMIPDFVVREDDARFFTRDGVLYDKTNMYVQMIPERFTSLELAEDIKGCKYDARAMRHSLERLTVRSDTFNFSGSDSFYYGYRNEAADENTVIVCQRGSDAEIYALRYCKSVEYLDNATLTDISFTADGPLETPQYEECAFRNLGIRAVLTYSDGTVNTVSPENLYYIRDGYWESTHTFNELGEYEITVRLGSAEDVFTVSVVPSPVTYRFDLSEAYTEFAVWEKIGVSDLNAKLLRIDPETGAESEVSIYNAGLSCMEGTEWTGACWFTEPGTRRLKLEYRGFTQEFTVNVSTEDYLFTTNAEEAVTEIPQFAFYTKSYGGNRLFVTHNGRTTEITDRLSVSASAPSAYGTIPQVYHYDFKYPDTTVLGEVSVWLCADYYVYGSRTERSRTFRVHMPLEATVVPGDVVDAYLDISDVPAYVPVYSELTAGDLGIKLVKTMADGSVQIDEDPAVYFHWIYMPGTYDGETLHTSGDGVVHYVKVNYGSLTENFTVIMHEHAMVWEPACRGADCRTAGFIGHWHCTSCGRNYAEEAAVTELENVTDGTFGPHIPYGERAGFAPTCTEEGLIPYYVCLVCGNLTDAQGNLLADPTLPAGHVYEWVDEIAPTCTEPGEKGHYTCTLCGGNFDEHKAPLEDLSIAPAGHTPGSAVRENVAAATCTVAGGCDEVVYCQNCPAELSRTHVTQNAVGHSWGEWQVIRQATVSEEGLMRRTCANDPSHVEEEVIPKLQPQTNAFQRFIERIREFFRNILDWFRRLFRF